MPTFFSDDIYNDCLGYKRKEFFEMKNFLPKIKKLISQMTPDFFFCSYTEKKANPLLDGKKLQ